MGTTGGAESTQSVASVSSCSFTTIFPFRALR